MANEKNLVELYVDSIGVQDLREMLGAILNTMIFRPADVGDDGGEKHKARAAQKQLAEILARTDAHWTVRELVLNAGRTLYYSSGPKHNYYGERLGELIIKAAAAVGRPQDGEAFVAAMRKFDKSFAGLGATGWDGGDVMAQSEEVIRRASEIASDVIAQEGPDYFSKSERKALTGVATPSLVRKLSAKEPRP